MLSFFEKHEKKCLCSFFSVHLLVFLHFLKWKKIGKNRKNGRKIVFFQVFSYALRCFFNIFMTHEMLTFLHIRLQNKNTKKTKNKILKLFLKNKNWTFIFVHFQILKRVSKNKNLVYYFFREMEHIIFRMIL